MEIEVFAPVGMPPVFYRECDEVKRFVVELKQKGIIRPDITVKKSKWWFGKKWVCKP